MSELDEYAYELPPELVAQEPLATRSDARLMVVDRAQKSIEHFHVRDLPALLRAGDCLVLNNTRVVPARLVGYRAQTRGHWEGLFLAADATGHWKVLGKTRGKPAPGETIVLTDFAARDALRLVLVTKLEEGEWVVRPESNEAAFTLLERVGRVPLPHYIRAGEMFEADRQAYQTVFAERPGAVAAPTAGLHFTPALLEQLRAKGIDSVRVTLHVGLGTFRPIAVERLSLHKMHSEWGSIEADAVERLLACRRAGGRIIAVGTTSVRVLEMAAFGGTLQPWQGNTELFIRPPYSFRAVDGLLTNFHLPRSTLLVLVRTFGGDGLLRRAYQLAVREQYRFFSYGDAMLIL